MDVSKKIQEQTAGDGSTMNQVVGDNNHTTNIGTQTSIVNLGPSTSDIVTLTTTVSTQVTRQALALCTQVAQDIASQRINDFANVWIPRISTLQKSIDELQEPKFHFLLRDASISAARSNRKEDLYVLSELLACHIEKGADKIIDAGIKRAINIVDEVDIRALRALTIYTSLIHIAPTSPLVQQGLEVMNSFLESLLFEELPEGESWIEHFEVLGALKTDPRGLYSKHNPIFYDGYVCVGIEEETESYQKALELLSSKGFSPDILIPNELLSGYRRIKIAQIGNLKSELIPIYNLYSKDKSLLDQAKNKYMSLWNSYPVLRKVLNWYNRIPLTFTVNSVGRALAQTNAKRCKPSFPDLI